nr:MAG TPA: hypothetical protein [Caudoviricetes sp.]
MPGRTHRLTGRKSSLNTELGSRAHTEHFLNHRQTMLPCRR